jgi:hypothetical protein
VLGSHIEMTTTAGVDYPIRSTYQPAEAPVQMTTAQLRRIREAIDEIGDRLGWHTYPDFRILRPAPRYFTTYARGIAMGATRGSRVGDYDRVARSTCCPI